MYEFIDVTEQQPAGTLPAEALSLNGEYIENLIPGYQTLHVSGRESYVQENNDIEVGMHHGTFLSGRHYPAREITVTFQLLCSSNAAFRQAFNKLNQILDVENAKLIFNDEQDKFFIGTPSSVGDIDTGRNSVTGEIVFTCHDPFKYSVEEHEIEPSLDEDGNEYFTVDYTGAMPCHPSLEADFYQVDEVDNADGECGYVTFANDEGKVLQFGNPNEEDRISKLLEEWVTEITTKTASTINLTKPEAKTLLNQQSFSSYSGWSVNNGFKSSEDHTITGSVRTTVDGYTRASSYGSGAAWHGPTIMRTIPSPALISGATSAQRSANFDAMCEFRIACGSNSDLANSKGEFGFWVLDSNGNHICGMQIWKSSKTDSKGKIRFYVNGANYIDLDVYIGVTTANSTIRMSKRGNTVTFNYRGPDGSHNATLSSSAINSMVGAKISINFEQRASINTCARLAVRSCSFSDPEVRYTVPQTTTQTITETKKQELLEIIEVDNTFSSNQRLMVDCNDAFISLMGTEEPSGEVFGVPRPDLGALGNDWEQFVLKPGMNTIMTGYSDWVADEYRPHFKMKYREVYI